MSDYYENYATEKVPAHATVGGLRVGMIAGLLAFAIPALATGPLIVGSLGFNGAIIAFIVAGLILSVFGSITGFIGYRNRLSSYMMIKSVFGQKGASLVNVAFALSLLGWYGVNMDLLSDALLRVIESYLGLKAEAWMVEIPVGIGITATSICGFQLLEKLSSLMVPVLALMTAYMAYQGYVLWDGITLNYVEYDGPVLTMGQAITVTVGGLIVSVVLMADFTRFVRKAHDTITASFVPYLGLATFAYFAAALAGIAVGKIDIIDIMLLLGLGNVALFMIFISSWLTNVVNIYSSSLSWLAFSAWFGNEV